VRPSPSRASVRRACGRAAGAVRHAASIAAAISGYWPVLGSAYY
jgi:hypothetical protein